MQRPQLLVCSSKFQPVRFHRETSSPGHKRGAGDRKIYTALDASRHPRLDGTQRPAYPHQHKEDSQRRYACPLQTTLTNRGRHATAGVSAPTQGRFAEKIRMSPANNTHQQRKLACRPCAAAYAPNSSRPLRRSLRIQLRVHVKAFWCSRFHTVGRPAETRGTRCGAAQDTG